MTLSERLRRVRQSKGVRLKGFVEAVRHARDMYISEWGRELLIS